MKTSAAGLGIDVGADRVHIVGLDAGGTICVTEVLDPRTVTFAADLEAVLSDTDVGTPVGIDGPPGPSVAAYADDLTISNKFRHARGCEVELGRQRGIWVSFATGPEPLSGWMATAAAVHQSVTRCGRLALETYPYAVFHTLHGSRPPKKTTGAGVATRIALLHQAGVRGPNLNMWSHDAIDATAAALVALLAARGTAVEIISPRDNSTIWLPS